MGRIIRLQSQNLACVIRGWGGRQPARDRGLSQGVMGIETREAGARMGSQPSIPRKRVTRLGCISYIPEDLVRQSQLLSEGKDSYVEKASSTLKCVSTHLTTAFRPPTVVGACLNLA